MSRAALLVIVAMIVAWSDHADAESPARAAFALESESSADARSCADREVLRARVGERLGRDPFTSNADALGGKLHVSFARDKAHDWTAEIGLFDPNDKRLGSRSLSHAGATCEALVGSVVLTIAVLLEDLAPPAPALAPAPASAPAPAPPPAIEPSPDVAPVVPPPPAPRTARFDVGLGGAGALGGAPAVSAGGELSLGLDLSRLRFELSGRIYLPASSDGDVAVRTRLVHGRFAPCWGWTGLSGCIVADVGSVSGEAVGGGISAARIEAQLYAAGGIGALSRVFLVDDVLFLRASLDLLFAATRVGFDVGERRVWTVPLVSTAGVVALGVRLP